MKGVRNLELEGQKMGAMLAFHVRIGWNWIRGDSRTNYCSNSSKLCRMYSFSCSTSSLEEIRRNVLIPASISYVTSPPKLYYVLLLANEFSSTLTTLS